MVNFSIFYFIILLEFFTDKAQAFTCISRGAGESKSIAVRVFILQVPLEVAPALDHGKLEGLELRLSGDHQLINAGLAVSLCKCWLQRTGNWEKLNKNVG